MVRLTRQSNERARLAFDVSVATLVTNCIKWRRKMSYQFGSNSVKHRCFKQYTYIPQLIVFWHIFHYQKVASTLVNRLARIGNGQHIHINEQAEEIFSIAQFYRTSLRNALGQANWGVTDIKVKCTSFIPKEMTITQNFQTSQN